MKQFFRFAAVAAAAALSSSTALAGNWVVPAPTNGLALANLTTKDTVYVWNVGQKAWINRGESWGTQAVVNASSGIRYVVKTSMEENSDAAVLSDGRYYLYGVDTGKDNHYLKRISDANTGTEHKTAFVDGPNTSGTTIEWTITDLGGNVYAISRPETFQDGVEGKDADANWEYVAGEYLGVNLTHDRLWDGKTWQEAGKTEQPNTYALWFDVAMGDDAKWMFISAADYEAYGLKPSLKDLLEKAETIGVTDFAEEEKVFNNGAATVEDIRNAVKSLNNKIAELVDPESPVDMTSNIVNPDFNGETISGWTSTTKAQNNCTAHNVADDPATNPDKAFDGKFYENWNPDPYTGKMYQEVKDLPNGVYKCSLAAFVNTLDLKNAVNQKQYVYFNDTKLPLTTTNAKVYTKCIDVANNTIEMGLAQDSAITNWMGLDNAKIEYYGSGLKSYKYITTSLKSVIDEIEASGETVSTIYTKKLLGLIDEANAATTKEQALAIYAKATPAVDEIRASVQAYKDLAALFAQCEDWMSEYGSSVADEAMGEIEEMQGNTDLSIEEINAYIEKVKADVDKELKSHMSPGDDATKFIVNPGFTKASDPDADPNAAQDFTGWTIEGATPGAGGTVDKRLCEVYQGNVNIYQDLKGIQRGAYKLEIQAFVRSKGVEDAYNEFVAGAEDIKAWIYAGDKKQKVKSIFGWHAENEAPSTSDSWSKVGTDPVWYVPNTMKTAYEAMAENSENYNNVVSALCVDGNLRIGFEANDPNNTGSRWLLFHDFKLTYLGNDASLVKPVLDDIIATATATAEKPMTATAKTALTDALDAAKKASAGTDGDAMMTAFSALAKANDAALVSVEAYAELEAAITKLDEEIANNTETASAESLKAAEDLQKELTDAVAAGSIKNEEVGAKITAINLAINAMKAVNGSDDQPADYTWAVKNPDFADGTKNWTIVNGTAKPGVANQVMEGYKGTFDVYQDIANLPEGTYEVRCQGFYRYGWVDEKGLQAAYAKDSIQLNAKLYANLDSVPLRDIIVLDEMAQSADGNNWKTFYDTKNDSTVYYLPDQRETARMRFDVKLYPNSLYTYVGKDGNLRIGFCNNNSVDGDWSTVSDFQLFYLGTDSKHAESTGIENVNNANVVATQYFSIDGRRTNGLTRGLNIIKFTDANGKTTVRKVIVK